ncbi:MAG: hypothetical protein ABRQ24_09855 [Syntrophomonadaceae bacterium]
MFSIYIYRIYETGQEFDLDRLEKVLPGERMPARARFFRVSPKSIQIPAQPLAIKLGSFLHESDWGTVSFGAQAKIYDLGAISLCLNHDVSPDQSIEPETIALRFAGQKGLDYIFSRCLQSLRQLLQPAPDKCEIDPDFYEDYTIYTITQSAEVQDPVPLLMGERLDFSQSMRAQVLRNRLSYSEADFAIVTWDTALLCDPEDTGDLRDLIEFANVQLLELRYYDNQLNREMEVMYGDIDAAAAKPSYRKMGYYRQIIGNRMQMIANITETRERIENLIKITEDIYYARVYQATLEVLRSDQWTASLNRKLQVIQQNYNLLLNQVNIQHSNFLEWIIIILIALEFGFAILSQLL